jgi:aldose 1-epimerase
MNLIFDTLRCELKPELGGCVAGLWWGDVAVLQSTAADQLQSVRQAASYPLIPYSNRMANAVLQWQGQAYPLCKNWAPDPHAIHGVGWERPWGVLTQTPHSALLGYQHTPDASWPFAFDATQSFTLSSQGLAMTMSITNRADHPAPVGLGWHPFFVKRPGSRVSFKARGRWEMGPDQLPTHCLPSTGLQAEVATLSVDHCFDGWSGETELRDNLITVRITSALDHLVVYTLPQRADIAIEPVSHANNAFNRATHTPGDATTLGLITLMPGETFSSAMRISIEPTLQEAP